MNYFFNKNPRLLKGVNNRYLIKLDKTDKQNNYNNLYNNNFHSQNNIIQPNNTNFFDFSRKPFNKDLMKNYNNLKKVENNKKLNAVRVCHSIDNNIKLLYSTNFRNGPQQQQQNISHKNFINEKENNLISNHNSNNNSNAEAKDEPTIVKIRKLIECLQGKKSTKSTKNSIKEHQDNKEQKENNILPSLNNNNSKPKQILDEIKISSVQPSNTGMPSFNNNIIFSSNEDIINRVNNTKIKLKQLNTLKLKEKEKYNKKKLLKLQDNKIINGKEQKGKTAKAKKEKVSVDNVMNIIKESLIIDNNGNEEKIVNIRLKMSQNQNKSYFQMNRQISNNPSNITMKNKKETVKFCMSNYNNFKSDLMFLKNTFHYFEDERTKKEKLVNKNQTMFKNPLKDKEYQKENEEDEDSDPENDPKRYSKYYLPSSGFGLLNKINK